VTDENILNQGRKLYEALTAQGKSALLDDRDERAGVKFKDADLVGIPRQIIVGKEFVKRGMVELKDRRSQEKTIDTPENILKLLGGN